MSDIAFHTAVMYHGISMLPKLRELTREQTIAVMREAQEHSIRNPLHLCADKKFLVKSWGENLLSGAQVIALLVYGLWVSVDETEERALGLMSDWQEIKTAKMIEHWIPVFGSASTSITE
jgi:hypothetical protein